MNNRGKKVIKGAAVAALAIVIIILLLQSHWGFDVEWGKTDTRDVGHTMFEDYGLGFIFVSFVLFAALLGGIFLAKEKEREFVVKAEFGEEYTEKLKKGGEE